MSSILRTKKIALVDCNSFYVSCERLFNPKIRRKPVVVLSNNDGCIISRSNEAKALGIKMGEPYFKAKDIILKNKVDNDDKVIELLDDISKDLFNYDLEFRIQELESKFSKDMSETTFNELKELKNERKIN